MKPAVSVVIVNLNRRDLLARDFTALIRRHRITLRALTLGT